ncbi:MAG: hypothetical protein RLZZ28_2047 [Bacteroidota bacterium]|jgi:hypothetical protein
MKKIKEEDLIQYLYKDCSPKMSEAIEMALENDLELRNRLQVLSRTISQLNKLKLSAPSKKTLKTIMKYAASQERKNN